MPSRARTARSESSPIPTSRASITNTGTITIDEDYTPTDADKDGDLDGPFAQGTNRFGIHVLSGGTFTGDIVNSGTITVEGNQSAGIAVDSALTGSLSTTGKVNVIGDNSVAIRTARRQRQRHHRQRELDHRRRRRTRSAFSSAATSAEQLVIQGTVGSTGYRSTTPPADTSKLDSDDLLQGGSAVVVAGNVAHGILLDAKPADLDPNETDEDHDGVADASETTANLTTYGSAPALAIGSAAQDIAIGAVAGSTARPRHQGQRHRSRRLQRHIKHRRLDRQARAMPSRWPAG